MTISSKLDKLKNDYITSSDFNKEVEKVVSYDIENVSNKIQTIDDYFNYIVPSNQRYTTLENGVPLKLSKKGVTLAIKLNNLEKLHGEDSELMLNIYSKMLSSITLGGTLI